MNPIDEQHRALVLTLCKPGSDILHEMDAGQAHMLHMAVGIAGEAGELLDAIKKAAIYQRKLDRENVREELGDLLFFVRGLTEYLGVTTEEILHHNIEKLSKRYPSGRYINRHAIERADKQL